MKKMLFVAVMLSMSLNSYASALTDKVMSCQDKNILMWSEFESVGAIGYAENEYGETHSESTLCSCAKAQAQFDIHMQDYKYGSGEGCRSSKNGYKVLVFIRR